MNNEIDKPGILLDSSGKLTQIGWSKYQFLDCNLENLKFYPLKSIQFLRVKRWDYYATFSPRYFFSATIADLGYAGNVFVYILDYSTNDLFEQGMVIPLGRGIRLPRNSTHGKTTFDSDDVSLQFLVQADQRHILVDWPGFNSGRGIKANIIYRCPADHESMTIVIPFSQSRFYYNRKINCMPAEGAIHYGNDREDLNLSTSIGSLDWGRGVWPYSSFWNWASASGYLSDGRTIGLNLGKGFGDLSHATENCFILQGKLHKLDQVEFIYSSNDYTKPWIFKDNHNRLALEFIPFKERIATTNLGIIHSEVHQLFGTYTGQLVTDDGKIIHIDSLTGFAEEHFARW